MAQQIRWSVDVQVAGGPARNVSQTLEVEAYDSITVQVDAAGGAGATRTIEVQPGGAGQVRFLLVTADSYAEPPLTYKIDGRATEYDLDAPLLLVGSGAVGALGDTQQSFEFTNTATSARQVDILVGRAATS